MAITRRSRGAHVLVGWIYLAVREDVGQVRVEVGEEEDGGDAAAEEDERPAEQVRRQHAQDGDWDEDGECVPVDAQDVRQLLGRTYGGEERGQRRARGEE